MKDSHIQWTDNTFNPWEGCTKVSPGCANCYAESRNARFGGGTAPNWGRGKPRRRTSTANWREPVRWNHAAMKAAADFDATLSLAFPNSVPKAYRPRVFCASLADWLDDEVPIEWLADLLTLVFDCGFLDWQLLTKRPENFGPRLGAAGEFIVANREKTERNRAIAGWVSDWLNGRAPHNVWFGVSVEDQARCDERVPLLLGIPAAVRFLSVEPLLGRVDLGLASRGAGGIGWVIVGGESGRGARPTHLGAIKRVIDECRAAAVPCFVKQLGAKPEHDGPNGSQLRHPKGGDIEEWPEEFRVREFPA